MRRNYRNSNSGIGICFSSKTETAGVVSPVVYSLVQRVKTPSPSKDSKFKQKLNLGRFTLQARDCKGSLQLQQCMN